MNKIRNRIRKVVRVAIVSAAIAGSLAVAVPSVSALSCSVVRTVSTYRSTTTVDCGGWTGYREYRAKHKVNEIFNSYWVYGPWVSITGTTKSSVSTLIWNVSNSGYDLR